MSSPCDRACALLRSLLTPAEYAVLEGSGWLCVPSPSVAGRIYRVPRPGGMVQICDAGRIVALLCLQPVEPLPPDDVVIVHLLMIRAAEAEYLATANVYWFALPDETPDETKGRMPSAVLDTFQGC